jgi:phosphodiesterase/alkaline phosphatase D-like protein
MKRRRSLRQWCSTAVLVLVLSSATIGGTSVSSADTADRGDAVASGAITANSRADATAITFTGTELLSRPTSTSISITVVPNSAITNLIYDYDTNSGEPYSYATPSTTAAAATAKTVVFSSLTPNTRYYYRMRYSTDGGSTWTNRTERSFWTARAPGSEFTFDITSDSHVDIVMGDATTWRNTLNGIAADNPDFLLDLGDTVAMRSVTPNQAGSITAADNAYKAQLPYFNIVSASSPVFLVPGNHEQKEGWHVDGTPNDAGAPVDSLPVIGTNAQKKYFPMPIPDAFYTGDTSTLSLLAGPDQHRENYYAWTWGDALFVVIDPFWYTTYKPYVNDIGGGETNGSGSGDAWSWTLGQTQFNWLKATLTNSTAKYKFIFTHQLLTDASLSQQEDYGHAGANQANLVEWGGYNEDGTTWGWNTKRAGWGDDPIHQILVDTGVSAVFHGHDHQFAYEKRDGVVYQALPAAGWGDGGNGFGMYSAGTGYTIQVRPNAGHLRVTVAPAETTVEYIRTSQTTSAYTYTIEPAEATTYDLTTAVEPIGGGTTDPAAGIHNYAAGAVVDVTATPNAGYMFDHWSGACTGSGTCQVTMNADKSVTAHFVAATGNVVSAATPSNAKPRIGQQVVVSVNVNMSGVAAPNNALGSFTATLNWDPALLSYKSNSGILAGFAGAVNTSDVASGHIVFNGANATGTTGNVVVFTVTFDPVAAGTSALDLQYSSMAAATTFTDLLPLLTVTDGQVKVMNPLYLPLIVRNN